MPQAYEARELPDCSTPRKEGAEGFYATLPPRYINYLCYSVALEPEVAPLYVNVPAVS